MTHWTEQDEAILTRLWNAGQSGSQIAKVLRISRNAVIGKVHRLELPHRETVARRIPVAHILKPKEQRPPRKVAPLISVVPLPAEPVVPQTALRLTLMQLSDTTCRRPLGDPKHADFAFCGLTVKQGSRYCPACHPLMYSTVRTENAKIKAKKQKPRKSQHSFDDWRYAA
jgi:GcrA cell cycle regulator